MTHPDLSLIIPALNEEQNLRSLVEKLETMLDENHLTAEILIVDDCSDDYTFKEALQLEKECARVKALHKGLPRGIGGGIGYGIKHAQGMMGVVVMGDGVDPIETIPDFKRKILDEGHHLVLLSRYMAPEDSNTIPLAYKICHWGFRFCSRALLGIALKDMTYAYRAFDLSYVKNLNLESRGFEISPEITLKTFLFGGRICEIKGSQGRRIKGESKFTFTQSGPGYMRILLKAFIYRLTKKWI